MAKIVWAERATDDLNNIAEYHSILGKFCFRNSVQTLQ